MFQQRKQDILNQIQHADKSPKGSVDEAAWPILSEINAHSDYVSTSSCSGRMAVFADVPLRKKENMIENEVKNASLKADAGKGAGTWLFVTHEVHEHIPWSALMLHDYPSCSECCAEEADTSSSAVSTARLVTFKYEPFVLHLEARDLASGTRALQVALESGYRNSGLMLSQSGRIMVAVRSTHRLEAPLGWICSRHDEVVWLVDMDYCQMLGLVARQKMQQNQAQMERFRLTWVRRMDEQLLQQENLNGGQKETAEERRMRKRSEGLARQRAVKGLQDLVE